MIEHALILEPESDAPRVLTRSGPKPPLAFACAGCSAAGRVAYDLALELDRQGEVEMSCLAGVGARQSRFLNLLAGRRVLIIDGCQTECARGLFHQAGVSHAVRWHVCLRDFGIDTNAAGVDVQALAERVLWSLYEG